MEKWFIHNILSVLIPLIVLIISISQDWLIPTISSLFMIIILEIIWATQIKKYFEGE